MKELLRKIQTRLVLWVAITLLLYGTFIPYEVFYDISLSIPEPFFQSLTLIALGSLYTHQYAVIKKLEDNDS